MTRPDRKRAERRGRRAEWLAEAWLRLKGYQILARRAKTPVGEVDLIARKGQLVVIIEVKQRQSLEAGLNAVPLSAWRRIARGAESWLARGRAEYYHRDRRFDLMVIYPVLRICHRKDTWRPDFALTHD